MKIKSLLILLLAVGIVSATYFINKKDVVSSYTTRSSQESLMSIEGRDMIYNALKSNIETGEINPQDYLNMKKAVRKHAATQVSNKSIDHSWVELGPDNIGGRTRALLPIDENVIFAGSVAGGLWKTTNGGGLWSKVPSDFRVVGSIAQSVNGDIYVGTGSEFEGASGTGSSGFMGEGLFRSTDGGVTFTLVDGTEPDFMTANDGWAYINALAQDPANPDRVWIASNGGVGYVENGTLTMSIDGIESNADGQDIKISSDGSVIIASVDNGRVRLSTNGGDSFFTPSDNTDLPTSKRRARVAVSSQDSDYLYVAYSNNSGAFGGLWQSSDRGASFTEIWSDDVDFLNCTGDQGYYDLALAVHPYDKEIAFVGGLTVWRGGSAVAEEQLSTYFGFGDDHVHPDIHEIVFDDNGRMFIGCDGGVYSSTDQGQTFYPINTGYNVTTFYNMSQSSGLDQVLGGAQDNGTIYIPADGTFDSYQSGLQAGGGDGFTCEVSLVTSGQGTAFVTSQNGSLRRVGTSGTSEPAPFYDENIFNETTLSGEEGEAGSFYTAISLFEDTEDEDSQHTIEISNPFFYDLFDADPTDDEPVQILAQTGNRNINFNYTLEANDTLHYWEEVIRPELITLEPLTADPTFWWLPAQALDFIDTVYTEVLIDSLVTEMISSIDTTFACDTGYVVVEEVVIDTIFINCMPIGFDTLYMDSTTYIYETIAEQQWHYIADVLNDVREHRLINDPYTSAFVIGFNGSNGIWLTREALNYNVSPSWMRIVDQAPSGGAKNLTFSPDGDRLYYTGWGAQGVFEISNIDQLYTPGPDGFTGGDIDLLEQRTVRTTAGGQVTGIAVDAHNPNHMVISVGQYGNVGLGKIQETWNALDDTPTWDNIWFSGSNELREMPCYDVIIDVTDATGATIVVGTEFGVFATEDGGTTWAEEVNAASDANQYVSTGLDRVPVFDLRQSIVEGKRWWHPENYGSVYAGTHGRGMFRSDANFVPANVDENGVDGNLFSGLSVYPNPTSDIATIKFNLASNEDVTINIYSIQGELIKVVKKDNLTAGMKSIAIDVKEFPQGNYIMNIEAGNSSQMGKFMVLK